MDKKTIFIIDDDPRVRESLKALIESENMNTASFPDARAFLESYVPSMEGCILLDIRMPGMSGMDLFEKLQARQNKLPVIFLTGHGEIELAVQAMKLGALDFLEKPVNATKLLNSIRLALDFPDAKSTIKLASLTPRERDVLHLLLSGKSNKMIASILEISIKTVEKHRAKIMEKMGVKTIPELFKEIFGINL